MHVARPRASVLRGSGRRDEEERRRDDGADAGWGTGRNPRRLSVFRPGRLVMDGVGMVHL